MKYSHCSPLFLINGIFMYGWVTVTNEQLSPSLWPCPQGNCWTIQDVSSADVRQRLANLWARPCPYCGDINGGCEWGNYVVWSVVDGPQCFYCYSDVMFKQNRVIVNTQITSCQQPGITVCAKNFYPDQLAPEGRCLPCLQAGGIWGCTDGFFPNNCIATLDGDMSTRCSKCTLPVLSNHTIFQYGPGFTFTDCSAEPDPNYDTCAFFGTPKWGGGYCRVTCAAGFTLAVYSTPLQLSPWDMPNCVECATSCLPGYYPPPCPGGQSVKAGVLSSPSCLSCYDVISLPEGAIWITSSWQTCAWTCKNEGYYADGNGVCILCPLSSVVKDACISGFKWLGCGVASQVLLLLLFFYIYSLYVCNVCFFLLPMCHFFCRVNANVVYLFRVK